ncbi:hypothetical protein P7K49_004907, partial [Saguinus oedipus]
ADYEPFLLFSANLKRELAGEQPYRRALRESGLPGSQEPRTLCGGPRAGGHLGEEAGRDRQGR